MADVERKSESPAFGVDGASRFDPSRITDRLDLGLERCGWKAAARHFDNAVAAAIAHDGETFDREIAAFRVIRDSWGAK